ncbi:MAG TPA: exodeoxyribonuclease I [Patescibacteria group bacterium]|nr:exodeoxyribonuclease I [Patescibacteria group bacterium]
MATSFFFYDLETSGFSPRSHRIMQFAGQRTDLELNPIGEPVDILIKMTDDNLPDVDAVLLTGITPQQTIMDGVTEAEFLRTFTDEVATPGTVFVGFNTIRFDDEFMRTLHYRNFYDAYEWQWQDNRGKWDMLDVVRMTRALRPDGIEWPFDAKGNPTNRLELLTALNKLDHEHAHDALSDVDATISVARLIRNKQTKLFDYLFTMRDKKKLAELVESNEPFVYTSGKYPSEHEKTTVAVQLCAQPERSGGVLVYDLRHDPNDWITKTPEQLAEAWRWKKDNTDPRLPVKAMQYNHCPAVAPLGVLDAASQKRLQIDPATIRKHYETLKQATGFVDAVCKALEINNKQRQTSLVSTESDVDSALYEGFFGPEDKRAMSVVRAAAPQELGGLGLKFRDQRLEALLPLYKARNYPKLLTSEEREEWERFRISRLATGGTGSQLAKYFARLQDVIAKGGLTGHQEYLVEELRLYAESIMPEPEV